MKHYRIVETGEGFKVQRRFLRIFWSDCHELLINFPNYDECYISDSHIIYYDTFNDAIEAIKRLKTMIISYKGHKIIYALHKHTLHPDNIYWIDLSSSTKNSTYTLYYNRFSKNIEDVKREIDNIHKEIKDKKKIKNTYYI